MTIPRKTWFSPRMTGATIAAALVLVATLGGGVAQADRLSDLEAELAQAKADQAAKSSSIEDLTAVLEHSDAELADAYQKLQEIETQIPVAELEVERAEAAEEVANRALETVTDQLDTAKQEQSALEETIASNEAEAEQARISVAQMARSAARGEIVPASVRVFLGADSLDELVTELALSDTATRTQSTAIEDLRTAQAVAESMQVRLEATRVAIVDLQTQADAKLTEAQAPTETAVDARDALVTLKAEQAEYAQSVQDRRDAEAQALAASEAESDALAAKVQDLMGLTQAEKDRIAKEEADRRAKAEQEAQQQAQQGSGGSTTPTTPEYNPGVPSGGSFIAAPLATLSVSSPFGMRIHPILNRWILHSGVDFRATCGTPIYAAASGTVVWAAPNGGYGNHILIDNGTYDGASIYTTYSHLSKFNTFAGDTVTQGQVIGYVGTTGSSTGCHLHFEVLRNGVFTQPMDWLQ